MFKFDLFGMKNKATQEVLPPRTIARPTYVVEEHDDGKAMYAITSEKWKCIYVRQFVWDSKAKAVEKAEAFIAIIDRELTEIERTGRKGFVLRPYLDHGLIVSKFKLPEEAANI